VNVYLSEKGDQIPTDVLIKWTGRSDLAPVPRTLEFNVKLISGMQDKLKKGVTVWAGRENLAYKIVKTDKAQPVGQVQGKEQQQAMQVTALLKSCAAIAEPLPGAVILENTTLGAIYRACGAQVSIGNDFAVPRFTCFKGKEPSYAIAQVLQEEGAVLVLRDGKISAMRITDMAKQSPVADISQIDSSAKVDSDFLQMMDVPSYYTVGRDASIVTGQMGDSRRISFTALADDRQLRNLSCVLVRNHTVNSTICQQINGGDVLRVAGVNYPVITAAHAFESLEGTQESRSCLWLGSLVNAR
jgi:hypothetical protein